LIVKGQIEARKRQEPGRKPVTICNPDDVARLQPPAHVMPAIAPIPTASSPLPPSTKTF